jgi:L-aminopeptidase/D-esterase-like protein
MNSFELEMLGLKIGHYTDEENLKGTTVLLAEQGANIGIDIRGSNTASFNIPAYNSKGTSKILHAIVLTGGSSYGLESVFGVMQYLEEHKFGHITRAAIVPGIAGAVIYDLGVGNAATRPGKKEGYIATSNASFDNLAQGNIGVGTGATCGKWFKGKRMKGGFGIATANLPADVIVSAFVVTNSVGDIVNPDTGKFYIDEGDYASGGKLLTEDLDKLTGLMDVNSLSGTNTTLAVIATNVALENNQLMKVAELAHDGMARAIFPVHTMIDGDIIFAISSHTGERKQIPRVLDISLTDIIGLGASDALGKAIKNSVLYAKSIDGFPAYRS